MATRLPTNAIRRWPALAVALLGAALVFVPPRAAADSPRTPVAIATRVYRDTPESISSGTQAVLSFTGARFDTLADAGLMPMWAPAAPQTVSCPQPGIYLATLNVDFAKNAAGYRTAAIFEVSSNQFVAVMEVPAVYGDSTTLNLSSGPVKLSGANGGFQAFVFQNSGVSLNVNSDPQYTPELSVVRLAPLG